MPNPVVHFEIQAKDSKGMQEFYSQLFGWHIDDNNPMDYGMVDTHAEGGINGASDRPRRGPLGSPSTPRWMTCRPIWIKQSS